LVSDALRNGLQDLFQLASVLEGLAKCRHCFMVTNIVVEPAAAPPGSNRTWIWPAGMAAASDNP
jgi:hypothetical protein